MMIEKPRHLSCVDDFSKWFDRYIEPVNKLLSEGVEVYSYDRSDDIFYKVTKPLNPKHKALLINITPIKKESAEDVLRDFLIAEELSIKNHGPFTPISHVPELMKRARAVLKEEK